MTITTPVISPNTAVDESIKLQLHLLTETEAQVIVHCSYASSGFEEKIRIWRTTFLVANQCGSRSKLLHAEKITLYPDWTDIEPFSDFRFTLIFSALPKSCRTFDLLESIPEPGGFRVNGIIRNNTDVYNVTLE